MKFSPTAAITPAEGRRSGSLALEATAVLVLALLAVWFIAVSWRKWPDPITDAGPQWFTFWRLSQGARLYHDVFSNYGPLSAYFNACLFKCFGPGMMVLAMANLLIYGFILIFAYAAFRKGWGRLGAFAALMVFISVFSFSRLNGIADYNFATPYANESTHGFLLLLITALVAVRWCRGPSRPTAFLLGLCGGVAAVLKPEFMLAGAAVGVMACLTRWFQQQRAGIVEYLLVAVGVALPTFVFTLWFARGQSLAVGFVDASQAWWMVLVEHNQATSVQQQLFIGLDRPGHYAFVELKAALGAFAVMALIWAAGWMANRPLKLFVRLLVVPAAGVLVYYCLPDFSAHGGWANGWLNVGACLPGVAVFVFLVLLARARMQLKHIGRIEDETTMALALTLLAGAMLVRMPLHARINQLGFYQAALAGMVVAAFMVSELPRWAGSEGMGKPIAALGGLAVLVAGCFMIARMSFVALSGQTVAVGSGRDLFYADAPYTDPKGSVVESMGSIVEWTFEYLQATPPATTLSVLPEGTMLNYLLRRQNPVIASRDEPQTVAQMRRTPPDYVVLISRDLSEVGITRYGVTNGPGYLLLQYLRPNYSIASGHGADPLDASTGKGVLILKHDPPSAPPTPRSPTAGSSSVK
jgi:hypothetical protein